MALSLIAWEAAACRLRQQPVARNIPSLPQRVANAPPRREAQRRHGFDIPSKARLDLRAKQESRVFGEGADPLEDGLLESESIIGEFPKTPANRRARKPAARLA